MTNEQKLKTMQMYYAAALADTVLRYGRAGILEQVSAEKYTEQITAGAVLAERFGVKEPYEAFLNTADIYGCANWVCKKTENGFTAAADRCMLCTIAQNMGNYSPCKIYCLSPIEAMIKGIAPNSEFEIENTLWDSDKCKVTVIL